MSFLDSRDINKQNNDFDKLCPAGQFEASYLVFLQEVVHPDDRNIASLETISGMR